MTRFMEWVRGWSRDASGAGPTAWSKAPRRWSASTVRFLGEQEGGPERMLQQALQPLLKARPSISRAYLARVGYDGPAVHEVVLCIAGPADETLVEEVSSTFANQFGRAAHLDIMFLSSAQEVELQKVCRPFYEAG